jgi:hypothetical protein
MDVVWHAYLDVYFRLSSESESGIQSAWMFQMITAPGAVMEQSKDALDRLQGSCHGVIRPSIRGTPRLARLQSTCKTRSKIT